VDGLDSHQKEIKTEREVILPFFIFIGNSNPMKNILFLLAFIPTLSFSQVSSWRTNPPQPQTRVETPRIQPSIPQRNEGVSRWRTQTEPIRPGQPIPTQPLVRRWRGTAVNPYGLMWGTWGWYQPFPYMWYDDWGWRQRSEVRIYENGKRDTVARKPVKFTIGIGHTNNEQANFWGTIGGKKGYFIMDYVMTYDIDRNQYYPNGNLAIADFPISKEIFTKEHTLYLGAGKRFNKLGVHTMIGFGNEIQRYQGKDDLGGISFPKSNINFTTIKFGAVKDFKWFSLKFDIDPIRGYSQLGIGLNNF
jgi:hypothetical protein